MDHEEGTFISVVYCGNGEIPEDVRFKPYMPLFPNTWGIFQTFGWDKFHQFNIDSEAGCYNFFETRFNESCSLYLRRVQLQLRKVNKFE
ncbi:MAG: hypothetical protein ACTSRC_01290 [Candidatus Helarchaeota archaeon]